MNIWLYFDEVGCFILMYDFEADLISTMWCSFRYIIFGARFSIINDISVLV